MIVSLHTAENAKPQEIEVRPTEHDAFLKLQAVDLRFHLTIPTRNDPLMAPPGRESLYVLVPVPNWRTASTWPMKHQPSVAKSSTS